MFDALKFVEEHGINHNERNGWVNIKCPYCGDTGEHLGLRGYSATCWRCGKHSLRDVLYRYGFNPDAVLGSYETYRIQEDALQDDAKIPLILPGSKQYNTVARPYIVSRGFDIDLLVSAYGLHFTGKTDGKYKSVSGKEIDFAYRVMIPVIVDGVLCSWTGRSYVGDELRYLSLSREDEIIEHKHTLYNADNARDSVIVCEGVFDVWRIGRGAIATFGTAYTDAQVQLLSRYTHVSILYDPEPTAQVQAESLCAELQALNVDAEVITGHDTDPGDMNASDVVYLRKYCGLSIPCR